MANGKVKNGKYNDAQITEEQIKFYEKIADYVRRHPEFVDELQRRIDEEEKGYSKSREEKAEDTGKKKGIFTLDEEKINRISDELSGMLFDRKENSKSALETTLQDAFSGMVKKYLSKYADKL